MLEDRLAPAISTLATFVPFRNGVFPVAGVVEDSSGNLFGASSGGTSGYGTVFEVAAGSGTITTLASSNGTNGGSPNGVVEDSRGNLFGTAYVGGASGNGTVFELAAGSGTITNLASFNNTNGAFPVASPAIRMRSDAPLRYPTTRQSPNTQKNKLFFTKMLSGSLPDNTRHIL